MSSVPAHPVYSQAADLLERAAGAYFGDPPSFQSFLDGWILALREEGPFVLLDPERLPVLLRAELEPGPVLVQSRTEPEEDPPMSTFLMVNANRISDLFEEALGRKPRLDEVLEICVGAFRPVGLYFSDVDGQTLVALHAHPVPPSPSVEVG